MYLRERALNTKINDLLRIEADRLGYTLDEYKEYIALRDACTTAMRLAKVFPTEENIEAFHAARRKKRAYVREHDKLAERRR